MIQGVCHDAFIYFSLLLHTACFQRSGGTLHFRFAFIYPLFSIPDPDTLRFGTSPAVNFTVEQSEVLSVVTVLVFNYYY